MSKKRLRKQVLMMACYGAGWKKCKKAAKRLASLHQLPARQAIKIARDTWLHVRSCSWHDDRLDASSYFIH